MSRKPLPPDRPRTGPELVSRRLLGGWLLEHRHGYRFSPELELLPAFLGPAEPAGRVVELGSGNGALLLAVLHGAPPGPAALGLEYQPQLVALARRNAALRPLPRHAEFWLADVRHLPLAPACADWVLLNPPFYPPGWGRESEQVERQLSTHEVAGDLRDFLQAAACLLRPGGRTVIVYGPERLAQLLGSAAGTGLLPVRLRLVRHRPRDMPARLFLECRRLPLPAATGASGPPGLIVDEQELDFAAARAR
ncbi:MAG: methyltransferase domain-containing protein [Deltaproteobacteria bacterium]|nr:methyltransferase domain-containing protein [Deltaproteobacteria bacterium]